MKAILIAAALGLSIAPCYGTVLQQDAEDAKNDSNQLVSEGRGGGRLTDAPVKSYGARSGEDGTRRFESILQGTAARGGGARPVPMPSLTADVSTNADGSESGVAEALGFGLGTIGALAAYVAASGPDGSMLPLFGAMGMAGIAGILFGRRYMEFDAAIASGSAGFVAAVALGLGPIGVALSAVAGGLTGVTYRSLTKKEGKKDIVSSVVGGGLFGILGPAFAAGEAGKRAAGWIRRRVGR